MSIPPDSVLFGKPRTKWDEIEEAIDTLYPTFQEYVKKKGHLMVVDITWIKLWYEFLKFMEEKK